ncbi:hypothetical protein HELRODRAFT_71159 [Helobdella robusta]|uniref:Cadherin domain-containing protein n=1 Tax=Helobdella robusta TaxID=6412 RepID=T1G0H2_HELRO|nr:hypothetical protein HELRODRAFT_71159 [Helobdella robusta]ESN90532.1 hypothetical protein HELRODRAFT_71159 [Helobdella robusta]
MEGSDKQNITFKIIQQSLNSKYPDKIQSDYFRVDERTGYLYSNKVIDRELICSGASQCTITLSMMMILGGHVKTGTVAIEIVDINDNAPQFPHPVFYCNISESAEPNIAKLEIPSAKDADSYQFNIRNFYLEPSSTVFDLHSEEVNGEFNLKLILKTALDREATNQYNFTVHAVDKGEKMGSMKVIVNVLDANDNAPIFEKQEEYFKLVKEDTAVGTVLVKVKAHDLDEGKNGEIVYKFIDHAHKEFENLFKIDNRTGEIILNDTLDFERTQTYRLSVTARDLGPDALLTHTTVVIKVEDVNDNAPRIKLNSIHTNNTAFSVFENKDVVQFVAHVSVTDADSGDNAKTSCYLKEPFDSSLYPRHESKFKLDQLYDADFKLVTSPGVRFDREDIDYYTVTIICRDHGMPPLTSSIEQLVAVIDENDNEPYFTDDQQLLLVYENKPIGTEVGRIKAGDLDAGLNSQIKFSLEGQKEVLELVEIDPSSGFMRTKNLIDRELISKLDLLVVVRDSGSPPRSANLKITIQDVNDNRPQYVYPLYNDTIHISNLSPAGSLVIQLKALDLDYEKNAEMSFFIISGNDDSKFRIDQTTNNLIVARSLENIKHEEIVLTLQVFFLFSFLFSIEMV